MDLVRSTNRRWGRFTDAEVTHLAGRHECREGAPRFLHRNARVDSVLVVEVHMIHAQSRQTGVAGLTHVVRMAIDTESRAVLATLITELRGENDLVASRSDGATNQLLVGEWSIHVRSVQEVDPRVKGGVDHREGLLLVTSSIELGHAHTAQTLGGDLQCGRASSERATRNNHDKPPASISTTPP